MSEARDFSEELRALLIERGIARSPEQRTGQLPVVFFEQPGRRYEGPAALRGKKPPFECDTVVHIALTAYEPTQMEEGYAIRRGVWQFNIRSDAKVNGTMSPRKAKQVGLQLMQLLTDQKDYVAGETHVVASNMTRGLTQIVDGDRQDITGYEFLVSFRFTLRVEAGAV